MTAWVNGFLGTLLVFIIATTRLGLDEADAALCVAATNIAGLSALLVISQGMRTAWLRRHVVSGPLSTWIIFLTMYFGLMLLLAPAMRDLEHFAWLIVPAILSTGFAILAYGPIQDRLVARSQRRTRR